jgi:hypothetical protein
MVSKEEIGRLEDTFLTNVMVAVSMRIMIIHMIIMLVTITVIQVN